MSLDPIVLIVDEGIDYWTYELLSSDTEEEYTTEFSTAIGEAGYMGVIPLHTPTSDRLLITVATGDEFHQLLEYSRTSFIEYANKVGADYIELTDTTQKWWGYEKFRVHEWAKKYKTTMFIDADCVISSQCPDLFEEIEQSEVETLIHDDFPYQVNTDWMYVERETVLVSQKVEVLQPKILLNSGVVISKNPDTWLPPNFPLPESHCAEQFWVEYNILNQNYGLLDSTYNWQYWFPCYSSGKSSCLIHHYANCPDRLTQMSTPISCKFLEEDGRCNIISELINDDYYVDNRTCIGCSRCKQPQTVNEITRIIANKERLAKNQKPLLDVGTGPGTYLKTTISWFMNAPAGCNCEERAAIMDAWGVEGCRENRAKILGWLRDSAYSAGIPYSEIAMSIILEGVITTASWKNS